MGIDIAVKYVAQARLEGQAGYPFWPGWLHFEWVLNPGAVFGIGAGNRWLFVGVSVLAIGFLTYLFAAAGRRQWGYQIILGMLLAGVLGNLYDRVMYAHVRDMFRMLPGWSWPGEWSVMGYPDNLRGREVFPYVFNVADVLLCVGVTLMLAHALVCDVLLAKKPSPDGATASST
jgi:signal peptidase II